LPEARSKFSDEVQEVVAETQFKVLSVAPLIVIPPPFAVVSVGLVTEPSSRFLSETVTVVELMVSTVPLTVRLPVTTRAPPTLTSPAVVRLASVPTLVRDDETTDELRVVPVRVPAAAVTVIAAEPSKLTPLIARGVAKVVAVEALPVKAPTNEVDVTDDKPASVVALAPRLMSVVPTVTFELLSAELGMLVRAAPEPENPVAERTPVDGT